MSNEGVPSEVNANTKALINMRNDITEVQKSIARQEVLVSRFDSALDKISEVSLNVSRLLAVHEQRLDAQEEVTRKIPELIEKRRQEHSDSIDNVYDKVSNVEQELRKEMSNGQKEILVEIKSLRGDMNDLGVTLREQNDELRSDLENDIEEKFEQVNTRVSKLERMSWIVLGGATVVGGVAAKIIGVLQFNLN